MQKLLNALKWDFLLLFRYKLIFVATVLAIAYVLVLHFIKQFEIDELVILLIFSDPVMLGFMFVGVMILFEKGENTLQAIVVNPLKNWQYLWSKGLSLTLIALPFSIIMAYAGYVGEIQLIYLSISVVLTSLIFVFLGVAGAVRVKTFNQFILVIPMFLIPLCIPILDLFGVLSGKWMYLIPTHASIILMKASVQNIPLIEIIYAVPFLIISLIASYIFALRSFTKHIIEN